MSENIEQSVSRGLGSQPSYQQKSYPFPTEVISLPSKGLCYPETSPLSKGEITIKLMTAKEEDILTSSNLIRKGIVLDKLLESIIVDSSVNINDLLIGDKNAIFVASRILAYGPEYDVVINDPTEGVPVNVKVDMTKLGIKEINDSLLTRNNEYEFKLPKSGANIKFKLLTHGDELAINKDIEASEKALKVSNEITTRFRRLILEVDGNRDLGFISNFVINQLQASDSRALRKYIADLTPDIDFTFEYESPMTGEKEALKVPIGVDFFILPSNYAEFLHRKIFSMIFNSNGGFTWNDVYYMPVKLREFYWRELLSYKDAEKEAYESMANSGKTQIGSGRVSRR